MQPQWQTEALKAGISIGQALWHRYGKSAVSYMHGANRAGQPYRGGFRYNRKGYKRMKILCRPEMHYLDVAISSTPVVGGTVACVNQVGEGTDYYQRNGRSLIMKYVQYTFEVGPPTNAGAFDTYHIAIIMDKQPNGTIPAYNAIYDTSTASIGFAFKNLAVLPNRFKILRQWRGTVQNGNPDEPATISGVIKMVNRADYGGTVASVPETNSILLVLASTTNGGLATTSFGLYGTIRVGYHDC